VLVCRHLSTKGGWSLTQAPCPTGPRGRKMRANRAAATELVGSTLCAARSMAPPSLRRVAVPAKSTPVSFLEKFWERERERRQEKRGGGREETRRQGQGLSQSRRGWESGEALTVARDLLAPAELGPQRGLSRRTLILALLGCSGSGILIRASWMPPHRGPCARALRVLASSVSPLLCRSTASASRASPSPRPADQEDEQHALDARRV